MAIGAQCIYHIKGESYHQALVPQKQRSLQLPWQLVCFRTAVENAMDLIGLFCYCFVFALFQFMHTLKT